MVCKTTEAPVLVVTCENLCPNSFFLICDFQLIVNPRRAVDSVSVMINNPLSQDEEVSNLL